LNRADLLLGAGAALALPLAGGMNRLILPNAAQTQWLTLATVLGLSGIAVWDAWQCISSGLSMGPDRKEMAATA
jgi:hypothetical protein